jgi:DNA-binding FrmR family transcriptional regulator
VAAVAAQVGIVVMVELEVLVTAVQVQQVAAVQAAVEEEGVVVVALQLEAGVFN